MQNESDISLTLKHREIQSSYGCKQLYFSEK